MRPCQKPPMFSQRYISIPVTFSNSGQGQGQAASKARWRWRWSWCDPKARSFPAPNPHLLPPLLFLFRCKNIRGRWLWGPQLLEIKYWFWAPPLLGFIPPQFVNEKLDPSDHFHIPVQGLLPPAALYPPVQNPLPLAIPETLSFSPAVYNKIKVFRNLILFLIHTYIHK